MKKPEIGQEVLALHTKYIINDDKSKATFPRSGTRNLNFEEAYPFRQAFMNAPRIGRVRNNRKREDELIAVPRGLLLYLVDEARHGFYVCDLWLKGDLDKLMENDSKDNEEPGCDPGKTS